jgi:hypothetical protein
MDWILADDLGIIARGSYSKCRDDIKKIGLKQMRQKIFTQEKN